MRTITARRVAVLTAVSAMGLGGAGLAGAATTTKKRHSTNSSTAAPARNNEPELTGDTATKAKAAALKETGGGTAWRASKEDPAENTGAAYEVHVTKTDGSEVEVLLASDFSVVKTQASPQHRGGRPGGPGGAGGPGHGPANEPELSGDTATQAKAAALKETGGGTAWRASKEDPAENTGAAYEVHVTKTDGSEVEVLLASDFSVVKTQAGPQHRGG